MITEPVAVKSPICESNVCRVFKNDSIPVFYRVEATSPDGTIKVLDNVRAYTKSLLVDDDVGRIEIEVASENSSVPSVCRVGYPYHYLHAGAVLCVLKNHMLRMAYDESKGLRSFGLNYNLFELPWKLCIVLHKTDDDLLAFATSRMEWDRGTLNTDNREVQMFIQVPDERHVPANLMKLMVDPGIALWIGCCEAEVTRKRH